MNIRKIDKNLAIMNRRLRIEKQKNTENKGLKVFWKMKNEKIRLKIVIWITKKKSAYAKYFTDLE